MREGGVRVPTVVVWPGVTTPGSRTDEIVWSDYIMHPDYDSWSLQHDIGLIELSDGVPIVIVGLGMFAVPEIVDLLRRSGSIFRSRAAA